MTAHHHEQIASYFDRAALAEVRELRCTTCGVLVEKFYVRGIERLADVQRQIHAAWQRHITPPHEGDWQI